MVTQEQIARKPGISRQLVTFALAGYPQVSEGSHERVLAAAREMGYRPNPHARAPKRERTGIIALWVPDQISSHYTHVFRELNRRVKHADHEPIVSEAGTANPEHVLSHVPVDGGIIVSLISMGPVFRNTEKHRVDVTSVVRGRGELADAFELSRSSGTEPI